MKKIKEILSSIANTTSKGVIIIEIGKYVISKIIILSFFNDLTFEREWTKVGRSDKKDPDIYFPTKGTVHFVHGGVRYLL
jgi:hypothetical protein